MFRRKQCEGSQDHASSIFTAEAPAPSVVTAAAITPEAVMAAPKLKRKNAMSRKSSKKHKSPSRSLEAVPTVVAIACVKDTMPPSKPCSNYLKYKQVSIALDSDYDATEEWQE